MQVEQPFCVVIDPGHGGEDGGAVGILGTLEKDINLSISKKLHSMLNLFGIDSVMTRTDDVLLYRDGQENRKKFHDVRNRAELVMNINNPVFVSVHQNKFPIEKYNGLQVYYSSNNAGSEILAKSIQEKTSKFLQINNDRKIKEAGSSIYLLKVLKCPAVLVECGFLSNENEEKMLCDNDYQKRIAFVILSSLTEFKT